MFDFIKMIHIFFSGNIFLVGFKEQHFGLVSVCIYFDCVIGCTLLYVFMSSSCSVFRLLKISVTIIEENNGTTISIDYWSLGEKFRRIKWLKII